ncbi:unnamed protein product [Arctia plantaginis]|uniref:Uncharacterized protein n=1 Tax=Arctia plantaginis TaxID=874455 RepID=A0A8S0ZSR0_ARCPL|nr:unnamed protein product [Arctia plantaginis]
MNSQDEINEQLIQDIQEHTINEDQETPNEMPVEKFKAPKNSLKRRAVDEDPRIAHALNIMDKVKKQMEDKKHDDDDIFAAAVATKLRKIKDERTKILVQRDIDNLLYDAIIGIGNMLRLQCLHRIQIRRILRVKDQLQLLRSAIMITQIFYARMTA